VPDMGENGVSSGAGSGFWRCRSTSGKREMSARFDSHRLNYLLPWLYEYNKLTRNPCSLIWEVPIHVATSCITSRPNRHKADNEFLFAWDDINIRSN